MVYLYGMGVPLFVLGPLIDAEVDYRIKARIFPSKKDSVTGYVLDEVDLEGDDYPILHKTDDKDDKVEGNIVSVDEKDLDILDAYAIDGYHRIEIVLDSGKKSWAYADETL